MGKVFRFYSTYEALKLLNIHFNKINERSFYSTYEALKPYLVVQTYQI